MCLCGGLEIAAGAAVVAAVAACRRCRKPLEKHTPDPEPGTCRGYQLPDPGSPEAGKAGCTCPVIDNCRGKGRGCDGSRFGWIVNGDCPLHAGERGEM